MCGIFFSLLFPFTIKLYSLTTHLTRKDIHTMQGMKSDPGVILRVQCSGYEFLNQILAPNDVSVPLPIKFLKLLTF